MANIIKGSFPKTSKPTEKKKEEPVASYVFHVSIVFSDPLIWRRIQVPGRYSLAQLHDVLQAAMGWSDSHVHQFLVGKISYEATMKTNKPRESKRFDEHKYPLHTLVEGMRFMFSYIYDAGEGWEHLIHLEEVVPPTRHLTHPIIMSGRGTCPPEEVGDVHQYNILVAGYEKGEKKAIEELAELSGVPGFDPDAFDLEAAKKRVLSS
jgi:hypothetical protein